MPSTVDGRSLAPLLTDGHTPDSWRDVVLTQGGGGDVPRWHGVRTARYSYVEYATGEREVYDLEADPFQVEDLTGTMPEIEAELSARLDALTGCEAETCREAEGP